MSLLEVLIVMILCPLIHEGGHALAALICGREFQLRISLKGFALCHDGKQISDYQKLAITAAGPAANLIVGLLASGAGWHYFGIIQVLFGGLTVFCPSRQGDGYKIAMRVWRILNS